MDTPRGGVEGRRPPAATLRTALRYNPNYLRGRVRRRRYDAPVNALTAADACVLSLHVAIGRERHKRSGGGVVDKDANATLEYPDAHQAVVVHLVDHPGVVRPEHLFGRCDGET